MGAVVLTHRVRLTKKVTQADMAAIRVRDGMHLTPPPAPGNYARHNAADIPALDANGEVIEDSVPAVLRMRGQVHTLRGVAQDLVPGAVPGVRRPDEIAPAVEDPGPPDGGEGDAAEGAVTAASADGADSGAGEPAAGGAASQAAAEDTAAGGEAAAGQGAADGKEAQP
jgi:NADH-quinone oxidoreductase subunit J